MKKQFVTVSALVLVLGCGKGKSEPSAEVTTSNPQASVTSTVAAAAPAAEDFCEVSIGGAPKTRLTGNVSSKRWGDEVEWPAKIFCPQMDLVGYGDETTMPMKPGKFPFYQPGGPKSGVFALYGFEEYSVSGEVNIESWDDAGMKGTYEAKGSIGSPGTASFKEGVTLVGAFSVKKPATRHRPFASGYCEYTVNDGLPRRESGGSFALGTAHWPPASGRAPSYPIQLNCGKYNFGMNGELADFPKKPGKYVLSTKNEPGSLSLISPMATPTGAMTIEAFDDKTLKGSFDLKGTRMFSPTNEPLVVRGTFEFKRP